MILSYRFCPRNGFGWKELIFKEKTFLNESRTSKIKSKWGGGGKSLWILGDLKKFRLSTFVGAIWNSDHQRPERSLPLPMKYKMSESSPEEKAKWANHLRTKQQYDHSVSWPKMQNTKSSPDQKARWANHLKTKRKMSRYPENIFTPTIFRAKNRPETSRSGRPCQCCRQEKCAEKVFLNDNLRMISRRKEQKKTYEEEEERK